MSAESETHEKPVEKPSQLGTANYEIDRATNTHEAGAEGGDKPGTTSTVTYQPVVPQIRAGRYAQEKFHARGGMGEIWLAKDLDVGRQVAVKRIRPERQDYVERFLIEAQVTGQLEHPGIVPVHDLGSDEQGKPFYVMKFVHGRTLKEAIEGFHGDDQASGKSKEVQWLRLLQIFVDVCQVVAYAHSKGVLHRDLKPDNVMLGAFGETLVMDWGVAKVEGQPDALSDSAYVRVTYGSGSTATLAGARMGTPAYMAPEVAEGHADEADQRTDIYLLGSTLYEILTNRPPHLGASIQEMEEMAKTVPPVPPRKINPRVPRALEAICLKALALRRQNRYATASDLAEEVQRYLAGEPVAAFREGPLTKALRWCKRRRVALARSAAALLILGLALFGTISLRAAQRRAAQLETLERARKEVADFRYLADEMRFYVADIGQSAEESPRLDLDRAKDFGQQALEIANGWGPNLEQLAAIDGTETLRSELSEMLVLTVQLESRQAHDRKSAEEMRVLLDRAALLGEPSRTFHDLRSKSYELLGDVEKAKQERRQAEDPSTKDTSLDHFLLGEVYQARAFRKEDGTFDRDVLVMAVEQYQLAVTEDPKHYWSHYYLGYCYLRLARLDEALATFGACVALRPEAVWGHIARAVVLMVQKRYADAEAASRVALKWGPNFSPVRLNRGVLFSVQKQYEAALEEFERALHPVEGKGQIEAAYYRGQMRLRRQELQKALEDFDLVVREKPTFLPAYMSRAKVHLLLADEARGLDDLTACLPMELRNTPQSREAHAQRGRLLRVVSTQLSGQARQGAARLAAKELEAALELGSKSAAVYADLGAVRYSLGKLKEAVVSYGEALKLWPQDAKVQIVTVLINRGIAYSEDPKNLDLAAADFQSAIRLDTANGEAHSWLGYVRALQKSEKEARREAELALLNSKDDYRILHNIACIYAELSKAVAAQEASEQDVAMALLERAVDNWQRSGKEPSEISLIEVETAFPPSLKNRPDFKKLVSRRGP